MKVIFEYCDASALLSWSTGENIDVIEQVWIMLADKC